MTEVMNYLLTLAKAWNCWTDRNTPALLLLVIIAPLKLRAYGLYKFIVVIIYLFIRQKCNDNEDDSMSDTNTHSHIKAALTRERIK